jgi:hypothetical protein
LACTLLARVTVTAQEEVVVLAPIAAPAVDKTSADEVRATRAIAAERGLRSGDIGSLQEEHLYAIVSAAPSSDETSGYGSVEASRAANAIPVAPVASTTQVPADVRWAPAGTIGQESSIEASYAVSLDYLPVALERGTRAESPVLWTILHPDDAVSVNPSDERIAAALFDDEPSGEGAAVAVPHRSQR